MEWNSKMVFLLINEYRRHELLWDSKNPQYYSKNSKHKAWCSISKKLNVNIEEIKKKFLSLQGSFRREKSRIKNSLRTGKGSNKVYKSKWFAYEAMQFLSDHKNDPRNTISSKNPSSNTEEPSTDLLQSTPDNQLKDSILSTKNELNLEDISVKSSSSIPQTSQSQIKPANLQLNYSNFTCPAQHQKSKIKRVLESDPRINKVFSILKNSASSDECTTYGLYVGNKIRNYQPKTRSLVQHYINNILFEADMGKFDLNSTSSSSTLLHLGIQSVSTIPSNSPQPPSSASSSIDLSDGCNESDLIS